MNKTVQIPLDLFRDLCLYFETGDGDPERIRRQLETKLDALVARQLYSQSKTAPTAEEREKARQAYLDRKGIPEDFRS